MISFTSIRNWATSLITPSSTRSSSAHPAAALIQPASPITQTSIEASAKATHCTSDDSAFDLLFAVYALHYLESEQKYKTWRRAPDAIHQTHMQIPTPVAHAAAATVEVEDSVSAESDSEASETPLSFQFSIFTNFEDDESSTSTSTISTSSEEFVEDVKSAELTSPTLATEGSEIYTGRVLSAIPRHITSENYATPKPDLSRWVRVADLDTIEDYDVRCLTPMALEEAELRSRDLRRYARMAAADLRETSVPLKAHEHREPRGMLRPSALKDLGRHSRLCASWTMEDVTADVEEAEVAEKEADDNLDALCYYLRAQIA